MNGISAGNLLFGLNQAKSTESKLSKFISKKDTNGDNGLTIKELGVGKDIFDRIDKNSDGQVDKFEIIIAAHARAAINNLLGDILPNKEPSKLDATA